MTMPTGMPFPGAGMMPGAAPAGPPQAGPISFTMVIPPDADWEPFETTDTLEKDGYYCVKIVKESARGGDKPGVWFTFEVHDDDAKGKMLNRFMSDSRTTSKDTWFTWRGLLRSLTGTLDAARQGLTYQPGMFTGQYVYVKTGAYLERDSGQMRTGIEAWSTQAEWTMAVKEGKHRWAPKPRGASGGGAAAAGMLPGGMPTGFPTGGLPGAPGAGGAPMGGGLPGAPMAPGFSQSTPQPTASPMQTAAPAAPQAPAQAFQPPPQAVAPQAPSSFSFGGPPQGPAPQAPAMPPAVAAPPPAFGQPFSFAQPPNGTVPQPTAAGLVASFPPGQPPQQ